MAAGFAGKTAVITGAGQGIGFEIARQLALAGAIVYLNDLDAELATVAAAKITAEGAVCKAVPGDAGDQGFVQQMIQDIGLQQGRLDIAIANAGITLFGDFLNYPQTSLYKVLHTNIGGSFILAQAAAQYMKTQPEGGSILFMSSVTGHQAHENLAAYSMTKAAIEMLAKNLVIELSKYKITVNAIAPGATMTERTAGDPDYLSVWSRITPLGRPGTATDMAAAACFLVSSAARHITGQTLVIDGGWSAVSPSPY
ncbi:MAG: SDR family oxidoreductase [Bacteroidetes bacterium]|nr:SDR family oxidoreductase [Bacteroidota bacterium]